MRNEDRPCRYRQPDSYRLYRISLREVAACCAYEEHRLDRTIAAMEKAIREIPVALPLCRELAEKL